MTDLYFDGAVNFFAELPKSGDMRPDIYERIEKMDKVADDLVNQLVPDNELLSSYARRGKASYIAGLYTNIWVGFIIGLVLSFVLLLSMAFTNPATFEIVKKALGGA